MLFFLVINIFNLLLLFCFGNINNVDIPFLDVILNNQMWSYIKSIKYCFGILIEIIHVIIQAISHYIFSTTEKNIRNEIVLITGSGKGLGKINIIRLLFLAIDEIILLFRSTNGFVVC